MSSYPGTYAGADLSHFQDGIDMARVKAAGTHFVILKASEGTGYVDRSFTALAAAARGQGLIVSAYHFLRAGAASSQAATFIAAITGVIEPGTRVWADFEESASHTDLHAFLGAVESRGWPIGIYTYGPWWVAYGDPSCVSCGARPLWMARYGPRPTAPPPWKAVAIWQFTNVAVVTGHPAGIDMSVTEDLSVLSPQLEVPDMLPDERKALLESRAILGGLDYRVAADDPGAKGEITDRLRDLSAMTGVLIDRDPAAVVAQIPDDIAQDVVTLLLAKLADAAAAAAPPSTST